MTNYPEIASRMFNTPLMLHPAKGDIIARAFGPRVLGLPDVALQVAGGEEMGLVGNPMGEWVREDGDSARGPRDIAFIDIEGSLVNKGKWLGKSSGMTSYEGIIAQALAAKDDASVRGVVYEVDSFGGEVTGAFDCAEVLYEVSQTKPTIAVLTDHACSAGYLLASAARQIVIPATGICGSIGVISMHVDMSAWLAKEGLNVTILKAGARKADFNPYEPIPKEVLERELAELEELRVEFAATVARYRAGRLSEQSALATEAGVYRGQKAVEAGLADAVARPSQVLAAFEAELSRSAG
ncbi:signal peptide peptidase SppA-like protein [Rhizobium etli 8C-3]|uniref:Signal peptide peptidase SppA-like protein n=1 Tax=Rhizobium etli 8C-3 TaxID=538025 RepID=A0A1L5P2D2_RHIET|nr:S49 family peptidase [Rhizobium etli]APO74261.1 signal peptide peptidase SppA-like protein [Rhizobium etli 8C-3]